MHLCSPADALNAVKGSSLSVSPGYDSHTDGKGVVNQAEGESTNIVKEQPVVCWALTRDLVCWAWTRDLCNLWKGWVPPWSAGQ